MHPLLEGLQMYEQTNVDQHHAVSVVLDLSVPHLTFCRHIQSSEKMSFSHIITLSTLMQLAQS